MHRHPEIARLEPIKRTELLQGFAGKWVAVKEGEVIAAQETPDALYAHLHGKRITGATLIRVPDDEEPEMVGLG